MEHFKTTFIEVYKKNLGIISVACEKCNISRQTYYDWMKNDPDFKQAIADADESTIDWAEGKLFKAVDDGNVKATTYLLDAKARQRGYGAKLELQHSGIVAQPTLNVAPELAQQFTEAWLDAERKKMEQQQPKQIASALPLPEPTAAEQIAAHDRLADASPITSKTDAAPAADQQQIKPIGSGVMDSTKP
jgi:hypothetical protein